MHPNEIPLVFKGETRLLPTREYEPLLEEAKRHDLWGSVLPNSPFEGVGHVEALAHQVARQTVELTVPPPVPVDVHEEAET